MNDNFEAFCEIHFPRIVGLLSLYCGDRFVAEDLAQDALARACVHWSRVHRMDDPPARMPAAAIKNMTLKA
jgi:DNA-directed RNA polymerase specialized sigma24 family protein